MLRSSRLSLACLLALCTSPAWSAGPVLTDLGAGALPQSISDDGRVVVGIQLADDAEQALGTFRWVSGAGKAVIGPFFGGRPTVSADGGTVGGAVSTDRVEPAFWTAISGWQPLSQTGLIPGLPGWDSTPSAISANGKRLAGGTTPPPVDWGWVRAFSFNPDTWTDRWADYGWAELPLMRKASVATATAISNDGLVQAGMNNDFNGAFRAVRWTDGRIEELLDANGRRLGGESVACNADCSVIVGGGGGSSAVRPILAWRVRTGGNAPACYFQPMDPTLEALRHYAYDTSENGNVVVGAYYFNVPDPESGWIRNVAKGFLWLGDARGGTLVDVQEYLALLGQKALSGWTDVVPTAVSADGRHLIGWGADATGVVRGWRVDFGTAPRATGPVPATAAHTRCPTTGAKPTGTAAAASTDELPRVGPDGTYRTANGKRYTVATRGLHVFGGPDKQRMTRLLPLGGDHYFDPQARMRVGFVRDASGLVTDLRQQQRGQAQRWKRIGK
jgi:uncharacterized membrane protein